MAALRVPGGTSVTSDHVTTAGDELLRWTSEVGSGSWETMRDAAAHLSQKHKLSRRPWVLANDLSSLGHIDIDWVTRRWSIAPPALNLVPGLWLCVVLTGSRPHYVEERFEEATDGLDVYPFEHAQPPAPAAKYAQCATVATADAIAGRLAAQFVIHPARALAACLRPLDDQPSEATPEPDLDEAERFDTESLGWHPDHARKPGLYRIDLHGRPVHRWLDTRGSWSAVDLPTGQFLALRGTKAPVMRWRRPSRDGEHPACLEVQQRLTLPTLAERAATVSSGLVPKVYGGWRRYLNVPQEVALPIAAALDQDIATRQEAIS